MLQNPVAVGDRVGVEVVATVDDVAGCERAAEQDMRVRVKRVGEPAGDRVGARQGCEDREAEPEVHGGCVRVALGDDESVDLDDRAVNGAVPGVDANASVLAADLRDAGARTEVRGGCCGLLGGRGGHLRVLLVLLAVVVTVAVAVVVALLVLAVVLRGAVVGVAGVDGPDDGRAFRARVVVLVVGAGSGGDREGRGGDGEQREQLGRAGHGTLL